MSDNSKVEKVVIICGSAGSVVIKEVKKDSLVVGVPKIEKLGVK